MKSSFTRLLVFPPWWAVVEIPPTAFGRLPTTLTYLFEMHAGGTKHGRCAKATPVEAGCTSAIGLREKEIGQVAPKSDCQVHADIGVDVCACRFLILFTGFHFSPRCSTTMTGI